MFLLSSWNFWNKLSHQGNPISQYSTSRENAFSVPSKKNNTKWRTAVFITGHLRTFNEDIAENMLRYLIMPSAADVFAIISSGSSETVESMTEYFHTVFRKKVVISVVLMSHQRLPPDPNPSNCTQTIKDRTGVLVRTEDPGHEIRSPPDNIFALYQYMPNTVIQFKSAYVAMEEIKRYEKLHGFKYDVIIKSRFDSWVESSYSGRIFQSEKQFNEQLEQSSAILSTTFNSSLLQVFSHYFTILFNHDNEMKKRYLTAITTYGVESYVSKIKSRTLLDHYNEIGMKTIFKCDGCPQMMTNLESIDLGGSFLTNDPSLWEIYTVSELLDVSQSMKASAAKFISVNDYVWTTSRSHAEALVQELVFNTCNHIHAHNIPRPFTAESILFATARDLGLTTFLTQFGRLIR